MRKIYLEDWRVTYFDAAGTEHVDCVKAESITSAIEVFKSLQLPIEWNKIIKVELKR